LSGLHSSVRTGWSSGGEGDRGRSGVCVDGHFWRALVAAITPIAAAARATSRSNVAFHVRWLSRPHPPVGGRRHLLRQRLGAGPHVILVLVRLEAVVD